MEIFQLIAEVGAPIAGALLMGYFIFIILKQMMSGLIDQVKTLTMFTKSLIKVFFDTHFNQGREFNKFKSILMCRFE